MFTEKLRAILSIAFAILVLCVTLWFSFWVVACLMVVLGIAFIVKIITDTRPLDLGLR